MTTGVAIHHVTLGDLRSGRCYEQWDDPHGIARMSLPKVQAFLENPFTQDDLTVVQLIASRGRLVVGREDLLPGALEVEGTRVPTSWGSAMFVPECYRGQGIGKRLALEREHIQDNVCSCGVSPMLYPIYKSNGWTDFPMRRYVLLRSARPVAQRFLGDGPVARAATWVGDTLLGTQAAWVRAGIGVGARGIHVEPIERVSADLDESLGRHEEFVVSPRTSGWLNWLLTHTFEVHPGNSNGLYLVRDSAGELLGYFLFKIRFQKGASKGAFRSVLLGSLQDWLILRPDRLDARAVIMLAVREMMAREVDAITVSVADSVPAGFLRAFGFTRMGAQYLLFKAAPGAILDEPRYRAAGAWRIRPGEGDCFFS